MGEMPLRRVTTFVSADRRQHYKDSMIGDRFEDLPPARALVGGVGKEYVL